MSIAVLLCGVGGPAAAEDPVDGPATPNFLAGVPLDTLNATRERPLFTPSRRGAAPALPPAPAPAAILRQPAAEAEDDPRFTLLGIIRSSARGGAAVVLDETDHTSRTLRIGDERRGWVVRSVEGTVVTLDKEGRSTTLTYRQGGAAPPPPPDD